jgi:Ca2+-transporting ATPase
MYRIGFEMSKISEPYAKDLDALFGDLNTDKKGLSIKEKDARLTQYGYNELKAKKKDSLLKLFIHQLVNPLNGMLFFAAIISLIADHAMDSIVIAFVILINATIGFTQEFRAEAALAALMEMSAPEATVFRQDEHEKSIEMRIKAREVVPGDILILNTGDKVPADARLIDVMNTHVDESMLTGESLPVNKHNHILESGASIGDRKNMVFSGTLITHGRAKALVVSTGMKTEMGKIADLIQETEKAVSPIKKRTSDLSKSLGLLALISSLFVFIIGFLKGIGLLDISMFAIATAVSSIPEGLPAVMTITLAIAVNRMAKKNAVIRKIQAVDTLGTISAIVSDKTGTLTTNQMTAKKIWVNEKFISITGAGYNPEGQFFDDDKPIENFGPTQTELLTCAMLCNDASLHEKINNNSVTWEIFGDPTEGALLVAGQKAGFEKDSIELELPRVDEIPFDSAHRYMATFHKRENGDIVMYFKGAPEAALKYSNRIEVRGEINPLTAELKQLISGKAKEMAGQALRVLGFAYKKSSQGDHDVMKDKFHDEKDLIFLGLIGMIDSPRPEVKGAISECKKAGIRVVMATGDHQLTAAAIAKELTISDPEEVAITGNDIDNMSDEKFHEKVLSTHVFARVSPSHKHKIVTTLQSHGFLVAVTGDGINDAPALKAAEVGVAMGITGTDVTKETADVVLTDDNFASIVSAVEEGRVVFENVRKVVKYLITTNIGIVITIITAFILFPFILPINSPNDYFLFTPIQILWVNMVTDGVLDITLAMEPKERNVMDDKPRSLKEKIIPKEIWINTSYVSIIMAAGVLGVFVYVFYTDTIEVAKTVTFLTLILFQIYNSINCKSRTLSVKEVGLFSNRYLIYAIVFSLSLNIFATYNSFFQSILSIVPISFGYWVLIFAVSSLILVTDEFRKWYQFRRVKK